MTSPSPSINQLTKGTGNIRVSWTYQPGTNCIELQTSWGYHEWIYYVTSKDITIANPVFDQAVYWVQINMMKDDGTNNLGWCSEKVFSLESTPPIPVPAAPWNVNVSYNGMVATITWLQDTNASYTDVWNTWDDTHAVPTNGSWSITLPSKGTTYTTKLACVNGSGSSSWVPVNLYIAAAPLPTAPSNVTVTYSGMTATITWTKGTNTNYTDVHNISDGTHGAPAGNTWTFNVPYRGVSYSFELASVNVDGVGSSWVAVPNIYVPTDFSGSLYKTATDGNDVIDTAQWHAFATKINQFRSYKGLAQHDYTAMLTNSQVGNNFMVSYYNEMIDSMSGLGLSGLYTKNSGDSIYNLYFDTMVNQLNSIV